MNVSEVIRTMRRKSGLAYERISMLAGCEVTFLERALREGRDMRVDDFCGIADVCGYSLCVRGRFGSMTIRRSAGECRRDNEVCASEVADRILEAAKVSAADLREMPARDRRLLSRLVARKAMPEVTSLARLCKMAGCDICVRRFREVYVLDPDVPERDMEVVVSQGRTLREMMRDDGRRARERQRVANSLSAGGATATRRATNRSASAKTDTKTGIKANAKTDANANANANAKADAKTGTKTGIKTNSKTNARQTPSPITWTERWPSGAECVIDEQFRAFVRSFG